VHCVVVPLLMLTCGGTFCGPGGQTKTPPAGPITPAPTPPLTIADAEQPLPSQAASKSTVRRFAPMLPNISITTQFWLARGLPNGGGPLVGSPVVEGGTE